VASKPNVDRIRERVSRTCGALPEVEERSGQHSAFSVRGKKFAYFLADHHSDGIVAITCKADAGVNRALIDSDPDRYYMPSYVGPRGWVALRLDVGKVDWDEVDELLTDAYCLTAPKRLAAQIASERDASP
jgi:phosphoribosylglycinamide formyltransferase-1